jgi:hypothetical protein
MERILALQALSTGTMSFNDQGLEGSGESNVCSSESKGGCSSQSVGCNGDLTLDQGTVGFW